MRIRLVSLEECIMTIRAGEHVKVLAVFENHLPKIGNDNGNGIHIMTAGTVFELGGFGVFLVVAGSAGLSLLHFRHGYRAIVFPDDVVDRVVAGRTVIVEVFQVTLMIERNISRIFG